MSDPSNINCEEVRQLVKENPDEAAIIIEMLKEAGEECEGLEASVAA